MIMLNTEGLIIKDHFTGDLETSKHKLQQAIDEMKNPLLSN
ncbi:hypothetical protein [Alkaliphilus metalliredigens]|nr:hypothetical protein [Alkaliphilus metalliredigens]